MTLECEPADEELDRGVARGGCAGAELPHDEKVALTGLERQVPDHGLRGFECLTQLIDRCECFDFRFGSLDEGVGAIEQLVRRE